MQCNCMMGVFPEISRAWLTIDSDIFMWNYEDGYVENAFLMLFYWYCTRIKQLQQWKIVYWQHRGLLFSFTDLNFFWVLLKFLNTKYLRICKS